MKHCMIDLETMSSDSHAAIVAIGALIFDPIGDEPLSPAEWEGTEPTGARGFYRNISLHGQADAGRDISGKTIEWWLEQDFLAQQRLRVPKRYMLRETLTEFYTWYKYHEIEKLWSHATFDAVILSNAYDAVFLGRPYSRTDCMDVRTIYNMAYPGEKVPGVTTLNAHDAIWDCYRQIQGVQRCYKRLMHGLEHYYGDHAPTGEGR